MVLCIGIFQNHWKAEAGRNLWKSPDLPAQAGPPRTTSRWLLNNSNNGHYHLFEPIFSHLPCKKSVFWCSDGISPVSICTYCLLCCHWAPLKRALLWNLPSSIYTCWWDIPLSPLFSRLKSPGSFSLYLQERCSHPSLILVALHWTLSSRSMSLETVFLAQLTSAEQRLSVLSRGNIQKNLLLN